MLKKKQESHSRKPKHNQSVYGRKAYVLGTNMEKSIRNNFIFHLGNVTLDSDHS